jgi:hypothetical protein
VRAVATPCDLSTRRWSCMSSRALDPIVVLLGCMVHVNGQRLPAEAYCSRCKLSALLAGNEP